MFNQFRTFEGLVSNKKCSYKNIVHVFYSSIKSQEKAKESGIQIVGMADFVLCEVEV